MMQRCRTLPTAIAAAILAAAGCGGAPRAEVTGQVTYEGQPVTGGVVLFVPQHGPQASGVLDASGRFRLETPGHGAGAALGRHIVYLHPVVAKIAPEDYTAQDELDGVLPPKTESLFSPRVPEKYFAPQTSGLSAQVVPGANQIDFVLVE